MAPLTSIVREEVSWYAGSGRGLNVAVFRVFDDEHKTYAVLDVAFPFRKDEDYAGIVVFARVTDERVVIEQDNTDRPLFSRLLQRGIPREQIVLAYAGEPIPDAEYYRLNP